MGWQLSSGRGGNLPPEQVATFRWTEWQLCTGFGGNNHRNTHVVIPSGVVSYFLGWWPAISTFFQSKSEVPNWLLIILALYSLWKFVEVFYRLVFSSLKFDESTGTWVETRTGIRRCARCKANKITSPLLNEDRGWACPVCAGYFEDPARRYIPPPDPDFGPNSWMAR
jgi:hypothetical protein